MDKYLNLSVKHLGLICYAEHQWSFVFLTKNEWMENAFIAHENIQTWIFLDNKKIFFD